MNIDLLTVARTLAERGWLPGIGKHPNGGLFNIGLADRYVSKADLHLAALSRAREIHGTVHFGHLAVYLDVHDPKGIRMPQTYDEDTKQGDTLALLKCLLQAMEKSCKTS